MADVDGDAGHGRVAAGRPAGAPAVRDGRGRAGRSRCARAGGSGRSRWRTRRGGRSRPTACNAVLVLHALTGDSHAAGGAEPGHVEVGFWDALIGPGPRHRHRPVLRRVPERAGRLPGHDRAVVDRSETGQPFGSALPDDHDPRPDRGRGAARRRARDRAVGVGGRRLDGRPARARVGGRRTRSGCRTR